MCTMCNYNGSTSNHFIGYCVDCSAIKSFFIVLSMANAEDAVLQLKDAYKPNYSSQRFLNELYNPGSLKELEHILSRITDETPFSGVLFKGKYLFLIWEDLLAYQKPLGELYKKSIAVCIGKKRKRSGKHGVNSIMRHMAAKLSFLHLGGIPFDRENKSFNQALVRAHEKYSLSPMPEVIGRKILEMCSCLSDKNIIKLPVVFICHVTKSRTEKVVGFFANESRVSIQKKGKICKQEELPTLSELKESHLEGLPPVSNIEISVFTCYQFLEFEPEVHDTIKPILGTTLSIQSEWCNVLAVLEPLQPDCKTTAKVQVKFGDNLSGAYNLHQELTRIELLHSCMKGHHAMNTSSDGMILERLKKLMIEENLTRPAKGLMFLNRITKVENSLSCFDRIVMHQREVLDFTDKLWLILKDASSISEMNMVFETFYEKLAEYTYAPCVCRKNRSTIAQEIRKLEQIGVMCPMLTPSVIYKIMIEIGVEKLRKDYMSIFIGFGILTIDSLKSFFEPCLLSEDAVKCLRRLHSILELTVVCVKRLSLPKEILSDVIRHTLKKHENNESFDVNDAYTFLIPPVKARNLLNLMRPVLWELSLVTHNKDKIKQTIHRYTTTPIKEHIVAPENYHPKVMLKTACYSYWKGLLMQQDIQS